MRKYAYNIDKIISEHLSSGTTQDKIRKALNRSLNSYSQNIQVQLTQIAEKAVAEFREGLRKGMENFVDEWLKTKGTFEVVPEGTRLLKAFGNQKLLVVEQKPTVRSLSWESSYGRGMYRLALPYVIFVIWFDGSNVTNFQMAFAKKPLESLDSEVYAPFLPNMSGFTFCMGDVSVQGRKKNISANANYLIAKVWNSTFNNDQSDAIQKQAGGNEDFVNLKAWERASKQNPLFVLNTRWYTGKETIGEMLQTQNNGAIRMVFAPIIKNAVNKAGERLKEALGTEPLDERRDGQLKKASEIFRMELYDVFYAACSEVAGVVEDECQPDADAAMMLKALERKLEDAYSDNAKAEQRWTRKVGDKKVTDYSYRPPWDEAW